jgi:integrase
MNDRPKRGEPIRRIKLKDGRTRYRVIVDAGRDAEGKRRQACSTWDTVAEARMEIARVRSANPGTVPWIATESAHTGVEHTFDSVQVRDWVDEWLASRHSLKPTTIVNYRYALKPLVDAYGDVSLRELKRAHFEGLVRNRLEVVSPRSVELMLKVATKALDAAVEQGKLTRNEARAVDRPQNNNAGPGRAWTPSEARRFIEATAGDRFHHAWHLSLHGLRRGEVLGLLWEDVDLPNSTVTVRRSRVVAGSTVVETTPKNGKQRLVPLGALATQSLRAARALQASEKLGAGPGYFDEGLVVADPLGRGIRPETYSSKFRQIISALSLPPIRLHDLRHTTASILASNGVTQYVAAGLLGHDPAVFAKTYAHLYPAEIRDAIEGLDRRLNGSDTTHRSLGEKL